MSRPHLPAALERSAALRLRARSGAGSGRRTGWPSGCGRRSGPERALSIQSNRSLKKISLEIFDRTFLITSVLRLLAGLVAFIGVLSSLMALQLERARELGVLRANGMTPGQVWQLVTSQTGLMGLAAGLLSLPVGLTLAAVMIYVINRRSFGWTIRMELAPRSCSRRSSSPSPPPSSPGSTPPTRWRGRRRRWRCGRSRRVARN